MSLSLSHIRNDQPSRVMSKVHCLSVCLFLDFDQQAKKFISVAEQSCFAFRQGKFNCQTDENCSNEQTFSSTHCSINAVKSPKSFCLFRWDDSIRDEDEERHIDVEEEINGIMSIHRVDRQILLDVHRSKRETKIFFHRRRDLTFLKRRNIHSRPHLTSTQRWNCFVGHDELERKISVSIDREWERERDGGEKGKSDFQIATTKGVPSSSLSI